MIYPDTRCWNNFATEDNFDSENFMKKNGILPRGFKAMIDRMAGTDGGDTGDNTACIEYDS